MREASGLRVTTVSGSEYLAVVGDRDPTIAWCRLDTDPEEWETVELASLAGAPDDLGQLEAVGPRTSWSRWHGTRCRAHRATSAARW